VSWYAGFEGGPFGPLGVDAEPYYIRPATMTNFLILPRFGVLVDVLSKVPNTHNKLSVYVGGISFVTGATSVGNSALIVTDPRRITLALITGQRRTGIAAQLKGALLAAQVPSNYICSFENEGALLIMSHPDDWQHQPQTQLRVDRDGTLYARGVS
jgi:hypothetical protein